MSEYELVTDRELQARARERGLYIATDEFERWYASILNPPDDKTANPHMVMISLLREEIVRYVFEHEGPHKEMTPKEYFAALGFTAPAD